MSLNLCKNTQIKYNHLEDELKLSKSTSSSILFQILDMSITDFEQMGQQNLCDVTIKRGTKQKCLALSTNNTKAIRSKGCLLVTLYHLFITFAMHCVPTFHYNCVFKRVKKILQKYHNMLEHPKKNLHQYKNKAHRKQTS